MNVLDKIREIKIVPVIILEDISFASDLGKVLVESGLPIAEVTLRTNCAEESIKILCKEYPELFVGAGTVLSVEDLHRAKDAGACFAVSPCLDKAVVMEAQKIGLPIFPGISTVNEAWTAISMGLDTVKFYPAEAAGGVPMLKSMSSVYPNLKFMPTGGINAGNAKSYLAMPQVLAVGGSWMVEKTLIKEGAWAKISTLIKEALQLGAK
jgi:2-dehydro-3-deoxyphosphogluconate aldolase/(4S)-4-hydroxy-2-oxoglutarate aldolase